MAAILALAGQSLADDVSAREIVRQALEQWRGVSSVGEMDMTIHRPDWERTMSIKAWTQGTDKSLVRIAAATSAPFFGPSPASNPAYFGSIRTIGIGRPITPVEQTPISARLSPKGLAMASHAL